MINSEGVASGGCWHVRAPLTRLSKKPDEQRELLETMQRREAKTTEISAGIRQLGYNFIESFECDYDRDLKFSRYERSVLNRMIDKHCRPIPPTKKTVSGWEILEKIQNGTFFGLVEVRHRIVSN